MAGKKPMNERENLERRQEKRELRRRILRERDAMDAEARKQAAQALTKRVLTHGWFLDAKTVLGFASYGSEIDTDEILTETLRLGKKLYLPRVEGERMLFYRVWSLSELQSGYKGIREPAGDTERYVYEPEQAAQVLMLMPGAAFDGENNRMGYGRGFYDRFLADKPVLQRRTIAVGFACQLVEQIPCEEWDIRPAQVICV